MKLLIKEFFKIVLIGCSYGVGAIPTGFWLARLLGITDIRAHGSGNIGATNVARILGIHYFLPVFCIDAGKAYGFLWLVTFFTDYNMLFLLCAAILLLIGNSYSIFLQGSGGKGVATAIGIVLFLNPFAVIVATIVWIIGMLITQTVGISSVVAAFVLPLYIFCVTHEKTLFFLMLFIAAWVIWRHRSNLTRYFLAQNMQLEP